MHLNKKILFSGGCKHAVAFLMWVHRRSEDPSPTEVQCYWKKSVLSGVGTSLKYITVEEMGGGPSHKTTVSKSRRFFKKCDN